MEDESGWTGASYASNFRLKQLMDMLFLPSCWDVLYFLVRSSRVFLGNQQKVYQCLPTYLCVCVPDCVYQQYVGFRECIQNCPDQNIPQLWNSGLTLKQRFVVTEFAGPNEFGTQWIRSVWTSSDCAESKGNKVFRLQYLQKCKVYPPRN